MPPPASPGPDPGAYARLSRSRPGPQPNHPFIHAGILFDASQLAPPLAASISLAEPGPRACARLWSAILEAATCVDAQAAARAAGKKGGELAAALPRHMKRSLLYEAESSGK